MRDAGISAKAAWEFATDEIVANVVFRSVQQELRSLVDPSGALKENPDLRVKFGRELTGLRAVEVHLSDVQAREPWRRLSVICDLCLATFSGIGPDGYRLALERLREELNEAAP